MDVVKWIEYGVFLLVEPGIVVLTLLMAATKRRRQKLLDVLTGRPGLVYPMDTLTRSARLSYCCAFGATAFLVYAILLERKFAIEYNGPISLKSLIAVLSMFMYGMTFFPVFASLALGTAFSYSLGSLYVWMFLALEIYKVAECQMDGLSRTLLLVRALPSLLCLSYLSISLPLRFGIACYRGQYVLPAVDLPPTTETLEDIKESYQGAHVRALLKKPEQNKAVFGLKNKIKGMIVNKFNELIYHKQTGFRYSSRLMSVMFVATCVIYVLTVEILVRLIILFSMMTDIIESLLGFLDDEESDEESAAEENLELAKTLSDILLWSLIVAISLACITSIINILHMMSSFRTNLYALYRGDNSHIPPASTKSAPSLCINDFISCLPKAYLISSVILFIICLIVAVFILVLMEGYTDWLVNKVLQVWPSVLVAIGLVIVQKLLATFLFLQDRGQHLRLDNRNFFFIFTYFMFFYNIFLGLVSCLLRIIKAMMVGTLFLARLDNSTLPRKFEFFDPGFAAYQGYIHMEAAHTHPVVNVFLRLLISLSKSRATQKEKYSLVDMPDADDTTKLELKASEAIDKRPVNIAARFNWHVTYTLLHNPTVRLYRKGFMQALKIAQRDGLKVPISDKPITNFDLVKTQEEREKERQEEIQRIQSEQQGKKDGFSILNFKKNINSNSGQKEGKSKKKGLSWFRGKKNSEETQTSVSFDEKESENLEKQTVA
ncbi:receptor for retinol uptake stra6-like [Physella acuta]|uniref:receptor for retinol uptake stra6-like n=1 Tax=Physella acuta TaxID=109671 RepID=UPI0027DC4CA1|nr:receptor for retinol uptake stra6-like [Physella acuta]